MKYTRLDFTWAPPSIYFSNKVSVGTCVHCGATTNPPWWYEAVQDIQKQIDSTEHDANCVLIKAASAVQS